MPIASAFRVTCEVSFRLQRWSRRAVLLAAGLACAPGAFAASVQSFSNPAPISINDNGNAAPYPSNISVTGISDFTRIEVRLNGFSHTFPDDVDILLVAPGGKRSILMSDAGGAISVSNVTLLFSQTENTTTPDATALSTGFFVPANYVNQGGVAVTDTFPTPGPGVLGDAPADLLAFSDINPNGQWNLYVVDDAGGDSGSISGGWTLNFTVPQILAVTKTADTNDGTCDADCSLREAIAAAQFGDLIRFSPLFDTPQTITLQTTLPDIVRSVTIEGPGAHLLTVRRDFNAVTEFRIFNIIQTATSGVALSGMTVRGGRVDGDLGGGIQSFAHLFLRDVHVTGNSANAGGGGVTLGFASGLFSHCTFSDNAATGSLGGGISFFGNDARTLRLINSTVSGNRAEFGAGIEHVNTDGSSSRLEITSSTITSNRADTAGGILTRTETTAGSTATTTLRNSIVTGNTPNNLHAQADNGVGTPSFQTLGFNLSENFNAVFTPLGTDIVNATPRLAPLAAYGGQTPTHALLHASPAIDAGDASGQTSDQRGVPRVFPSNGSADIGAVEMRPLVVTNDNNGGAGSLRNALGSGGNAVLTDIQFENGFFSTPRTITLTTGQLGIFFNANLLAPGANLLSISGNSQSRVFEVPATITATLSGMTITGGNGSGGQGGGIFNGGTLAITHSSIAGNTTPFIGGGIHSQGRLTVSDSVISGNSASNAGGIESAFSTLQLMRSTVSNNHANFQGGGVRLFDASGVIAHSTISDNTANGAQTSAGGIYVESAVTSTVEVTNSTVANNLAGAAGAGGVRTVSVAPGIVTTLIRNTIIANNSLPNVGTQSFGGGGSATVVSLGFNLASDDSSLFLGQVTDRNNAFAALAPLANNGGSTPTHALLGGSAALDAGHGSGATSDQRQLARAVDLPGVDNANLGDGSDIGAFEAQSAPATPAFSIDDVSASEGQAGTTAFTFAVTLSIANAQAVSVDVQTANGTATAPSDYSAIPQDTLTFLPGETSKPVVVLVNGDAAVEANETFFINLLNNQGALVSDGQAVGTILNDDISTVIFGNGFEGGP